MNELENIQNQDISHDIVEYRTIYSKMKVEEDKFMKSITATELKKNLGKYLDQVNEEDVEITKNGKVIAILRRPYTKEENLEWVEGLVGMLLPPERSTPEDINKSAKQLHHERLEKKYGSSH